MDVDTFGQIAISVLFLGMIIGSILGFWNDDWKYPD